MRNKRFNFEDHTVLHDKNALKFEMISSSYAFELILAHGNERNLLLPNSNSNDIALYWKTLDLFFQNILKKGTRKKQNQEQIKCMRIVHLYFSNDLVYEVLFSKINNCNQNTLNRPDRPLCWYLVDYNQVQFTQILIENSS